MIYTHVLNRGAGAAVVGWRPTAGWFGRKGRERTHTPMGRIPAIHAGNAHVI
jgi:hypothetical protein